MSEDNSPDHLNQAAQSRLKSFMERIEKMEEEKAAVGADIKEIYMEAKGEGFDVKILRKVVALRRLSPAMRAEIDSLVDLYMAAVGAG